RRRSMQVQSRQYCVQSNPAYDFYTGLLRCGNQAIIGRDAYYSVAVFRFDADGSFLDVHHHDLPKTIPVNAELRVREDQEAEALFLEFLANAFGFVEGAIHVKKFAVPAEHLAIYEMPKHISDFLEHPDE